MGEITIKKTGIPDVLLLTPKKFGDSRGFFLESYSRRDYDTIGIAQEFVQDNHSRSIKGVLRGLHYQHPQSQDKLIRVTLGCIYDVAVDIRSGSPTYGRWIGVELSEDDPTMIFVPSGFAHGFLVLSEVAEVQYKVNEYYNPEAEGGLQWNDPEIGIVWPLLENGIDHPLLSEKDKKNVKLSEFTTPFTYRGNRV